MLLIGGQENWEVSFYSVYFINRRGFLRGVKLYAVGELWTWCLSCFWQSGGVGCVSKCPSEISEKGHEVQGAADQILTYWQSETFL